MTVNQGGMYKVVFQALYFCSFKIVSFSWKSTLTKYYLPISSTYVWFSCPRLSSQLWWRVRTGNWWGWKFLRCFSFKLQCLKFQSAKHFHFKSQLSLYCGLKETFWEGVPKQIISDHSKRSCFKLRQHHLRVHHPYTASHQNRGFITFQFPLSALDLTFPLPQITKFVF